MIRIIRSGESLKQQGQSAALSAAYFWSDRADQWLESLKDGETLASEDGTDKVGWRTDEVGMNKNNAVGAKITAAAKAGLIEPVDYVKSKRPSSHGAVIRVWRKNATV